MGLLSPFWGGICHLPLLNPTLKAKTLPPSSIFPDSPCPSDKLLSFQNREGMGKEEAEKPCLAMARSRPTTPQASLKLKVFTPKTCPRLHSDKGQSRVNFWSSPDGRALLLTSAGSAFHPVICLCCRSGFAGVLHAAVERVHLVVLAAIVFYKL